MSDYSSIADKLDVNNIGSDIILDTEACNAKSIKQCDASLLTCENVPTTTTSIIKAYKKTWDV